MPLNPWSPKVYLEPERVPWSIKPANSKLMPEKDFDINASKVIADTFSAPAKPWFPKALKFASPGRWYRPKNSVFP